MFKTVTLSDGNPCQVRVLGLVELDGKVPEVLGPYRYSILTATGQIIEDEYNPRAFETPPKPPDIPLEETEQGSYEWQQWKEYETYQAAIAHEKKRVASYEARLEAIAQYILDNSLEPDDLKRIVTPDDWRLIHKAALIPELTEEVLADTLRETFPGLVWEFRDFASLDVSGEGEGQDAGGKAMGTGDDQHSGLA